MSQRRGTTPGDAIDALLKRYHRVGPAGDEASEAASGTHRQKFQLVPTAKLRDAVGRGVNPFRLASDPLVQETRARERAKQQHRKQQGHTKRRRASASEHFTPDSAKRTRSGRSPREQRQRRAAKKAPGEAPKQPKHQQAASKSKAPPPETSRAATAKGSQAFNTHKARSTAAAVPLSVQTQHRELGLGTSASSAARGKAPVAAAVAQTLDATSDRNKRALQERTRATQRQRQPWVRPCTARHVRHSLAGVTLPRRLAHFVRVVVSPSPASVGSTSTQRHDRRLRRLVRESIRHRNENTSHHITTRSCTTRATRHVPTTRESRHARFRAVVSDAVQCSVRMNWALMGRALRERQRFLEPLNARHGTEAVGLTVARSFPLFGAVVEVMRIDFRDNVAGPTQMRKEERKRTKKGLGLPLARQSQRRLGLVLAETPKQLVVMLLPTPLETDDAACAAFLDALRKDGFCTSEEASAGGTPPVEVMKVPKLFPGASGTFTDVEQYVLSPKGSTALTMRGPRHLHICAYLGEAAQMNQSPSILSGLVGRCL